MNEVRVMRTRGDLDGGRREVEVTMPEEPAARRPRYWLCWLSVMLAVLPLVYLGSMGPVTALAVRWGCDVRPVAAFYRPVLPRRPSASRFDRTVFQYMRF